MTPFKAKYSPKQHSFLSNTPPRLSLNLTPYLANSQSSKPVKCPSTGPFALIYDSISSCYTEWSRNRAVMRAIRLSGAGNDRPAIQNYFGAREPIGDVLQSARGVPPAVRIFSSYYVWVTVCPWMTVSHLNRTDLPIFRHHVSMKQKQNISVRARAHVCVCVFPRSE